MGLAHFARAYMANETLKMNQLELGLSNMLKVAMSVRVYTSYQDIYNTTISVKQAYNEREVFFNI